MTKEEKLIAKKLDSERRKALWKSRIIKETKEEFKQSILKISYDIDQIVYGHKKLKGFYDD